MCIKKKKKKKSHVTLPKQSTWLDNWLRKVKMAESERFVCIDDFAPVFPEVMISFSWTHGMETALYSQTFCDIPISYICNLYGNIAHDWLVMLWQTFLAKQFCWLDSDSCSIGMLHHSGAHHIHCFFFFCSFPTALFCSTCLQKNILLPTCYPNYRIRDEWTNRQISLWGHLVNSRELLSMHFHSSTFPWKELAKLARSSMPAWYINSPHGQVSVYIGK